MKFPNFIYKVYGYFDTLKGWSETIKWFAQVAVSFADFVSTIPAPPGYSEWRDQERAAASGTDSKGQSEETNLAEPDNGDAGV